MISSDIFKHHAPYSTILSYLVDELSLFSTYSWSSFIIDKPPSLEDPHLLELLIQDKSAIS